MRRKPLGICVVCGASCYPFDNQCQECVEKKYLNPEERMLLPMIQHRHGKLQGGGASEFKRSGRE